MRKTIITAKTMKSIKTIIAASLLAITLGSCSDNEYPVYDTSYSALNIWLGTSAIASDSVTYNYSYTLEEGEVTFYARVVGELKDYDRTFELEVFDGDIEEAEGSYTLSTYTIPAGEYLIEGTITFDTSKLKDEDSFTETDGHLYLRMAENDEFTTGVEEYSELVIVLKNYLSKPDNWDSATYPYRALSLYFGTYSKVKYQFMIQVLGLIDFQVSYTASVTYNEETNVVSTNYVNYLVSKMQLALDEYNSTHDTPLTDETGALVTF